MIEVGTRNKKRGLKSLGTKKKHEIIALEMIDGEAIEIYGGNNLAD